MAVLILIFALTAQVYGKFDPIAFTVAQTTATFAGTSTIQYTSNITTHNSATNIFRGVFTCTRNGTYKFHVFGSSATNGQFLLDMFKNNIPVATLYGHVQNERAVAGNTLIVQLKVGDTVQVKNKDTSPLTLYSFYNENTFTGVELGSMFLYSDVKRPLAFSATSNSNQLIAGDDIVQYNNKLVDDGGALDLSTGIFTAKSSGYYVFHFHSTSMQHEDLWLELWVNNIYVCSIYAFTDFDWATAGNSAILHLLAGDQAAVLSKYGHENRLMGSAEYMFTSFSGAQIVSDDDLRSPDTEPVVIFSVGLTKNISLNNGNVVVFDRVFVDLKRSYNMYTGMFVVPSTGLYEFHYHCIASKNNYLTLALVKGNSVVNGFNQIRNPVHTSYAGNAAVFQLTAGETVSVQARTNYMYVYMYLVGTLDGVFCTFSGYMLLSTGPSIG